MYEDFDEKKVKKNMKKKETVEDVVLVEEENDKEKKTVMGLKADWVSILVKFCIFLLVAFLLIFVITKLRNLGNQNSFSNNLEKMRDAAYLYYKVDERRPILDGDSIRMTLGDMIDSGLVTELKEKDTVCSKDYSYVDLIRKEKNLYDMYVYLTCGGEAKEGTYDVTYRDENTSEDSDVLYELKRTVSTNDKYSCPDGYVKDGKRCLGPENVVTIKANPIYKVSPRKEVAAIYKSPGYNYEYVDAIVSSSSNSYRCPNGYQLTGTQCVKKEEALVRTSNTYDCPKGSTLNGTLCVFTTSASYNNQVAYCSTGSLINGNECYIKKSYSVKCSIGSYDSSVRSCYKTYSASKTLSDWLFDSKVTYSSKTTPKNSEKVRFEFDFEKENGSIVYKKYIKKYVSTCDGGDELFGNTCRHYDSSYVQKYCTGDYHLNSSGTECYRTTAAKHKDTVGTYSCPEGYTKKGSGTSSYCYKYEKGTKMTKQEAYCLSGYELTSSNECVKTVEATKLEQNITYSCPKGYESRGSGVNTTCYKKTTTEGYYYCSNSSMSLEGNVCVIPQKTTFSGYYCPKGYSLSGSTCFRSTGRDAILATENENGTSTTETIWSKEKDLDGWTWTGKTKESDN